MNKFSVATVSALYKQLSSNYNKPQDETDKKKKLARIHALISDKLTLRS